MAEPVPLDREWLSAHPLCAVDEETDKNERGRVLVVGGSRRSPGALRLTGEAAFRAGAGKVQLATLASLGAALGVAVPEAGFIDLPEGEEGELAGNARAQLGDAFEACDCAVLGPGMGDADAAGALLDAALAALDTRQSLVLDAAAIRAAPSRLEALSRSRAAIVLTPHAGEMAALLGKDDDDVRRDPRLALEAAIAACGHPMVIKGPVTFIGAPDSAILAFVGGGPGLATGGSGDVLAGIVAALLARGQDALSALAWAVWLHGEAGRRLGETQAPVGYLARELTPVIPALIRGFA